MKTKKQLERLRKIHQLIKIAHTGTPNEFANKLGICRSQLHNILNDLILKGFPIHYSRSQKTYIYYDYCDLEIQYSIHLLTNNEKIKIDGGQIHNCLSPMQLDWMHLS